MAYRDTIRASCIDAVCYAKEATYLFEFKLRLKYSAIGQLSGYLDWFKRQYYVKEPVIPVAVFRYDRPELHETCKRLGIRMLQLTERSHKWIP